MRPEWRIDRSFVLMWPPANQRQILLAYLVVLELMRKMLLSRAMPGEDQHAARVLVETMHETKTRILLPADRQVELLAKLFEDAAAFIASGNGWHPRRLVHRHIFVIRPEDLQGTGVARHERSLAQESGPHVFPTRDSLLHPGLLGMDGQALFPAR